MASVLFQNALLSTFNKLRDWDTDNLDARLLMTNTTVDTEPDKDTVAGFTTLDQCDATGYAIEDITTPAISADDIDMEFVWSSDDWAWGGLSGDASRAYQGALVVFWVDGGTGDIPVLFVDFTADVVAAATQVTAPCPAEGWLNIGQPA